MKYIGVDAGGEYEYPSINSVRYDGFDVSNVNKCLRGRSKTYRGYEWRYLW